MLETTWFVIWGVAWAVYLLLDGFDLGLGSLLPFLGASERDRRVIVNAMGPFWDGNEVWLITAGGVTFAAFPKTYAIMFSALYTPLMLLLFALILRGVSFEFRNKVDSASWRRVWDATLVVGSFAPALLLGVFFANLFKGVPVDASGVLQGNLLTLLNPYGLLGGVLFVLLFAVHGANWLAIKAEGELHDRAVRTAKALWWPLAAVAVAFLVATWFATPLWRGVLARPVTIVFPLVAVAGLVLARGFACMRREWPAWIASAATIAGAAGFGVAGMYPNLLASSLDPEWSLTAGNSASSPLTLKIMLGIVLLVLPAVIAYQAWVYARFSEKVDESILGSTHSY